MTTQVNENDPATIDDGAIAVSRVHSREYVAIKAYAEAVKEVLEDFSANQYTREAGPSLLVSEKTAQSLYDELFLMGFRFGGTEDPPCDPPALKTQPVVVESTPSSTKIHKINPECCGPWFVESSDEHA